MDPVVQVAPIGRVESPYLKKFGTPKQVPRVLSYPYNKKSMIVLQGLYSLSLSRMSRRLHHTMYSMRCSRPD